MTPGEKGQSGRDEGHRDLLAAIGKAIRLRRVELDMKRSELAGRSGLSYAYVAEIENGTKQASSKALWQLGGALGLEPHELMTLAARLESRGPSPAASSLWRLTADRAMRAEVPPDAVESLARAGGVQARAAAGEGRRAGWFHVAPSAALAGEEVSGGAGGGAGGEAGGEAAGLAAAGEAPALEPGAPAAAPGLPELLARVEAALEDIPGERAELVLMLALDEHRTRRIVREELGRLRPGG